VDVTWLNDQVFSAGYAYDRESDPLQDFRVDDHAYFAQQQFAIADHWHVTVGGRVDDHSDYGTEFSPKLSAGGYPLPFRRGPLSSLKVFTSIGKGIKNPVFGELFGSAFVDGNPDLRPERARTVDAGLEVTLDNQRWMGRATYFDNAYTDQVAFQFSPGFGGDGVPDFLNIAGSDALEASLQRPLAGLTAHLSYALVDTKVVSTASPSDQF
jgi:outer membrane receptor protein involved in Fe transport